MKFIILLFSRLECLIIGHDWRYIKTDIKLKGLGGRRKAKYEACFRCERTRVMIVKAEN